MTVRPGAFWQHSDRGLRDGTNGPVDFNVFHGMVEELQVFVDGIKETPLNKKQ